MAETSTVLLAAGYVLAVPLTLFTPGFLRMWRRREPWAFVTAEAGAALITAGWLVKGSAVSTAVNATWLVGFAAAYAAEGRKRSRRSA